MQQFRIDFAMNRGHEMTIDREKGIYRNELDELELQMLQSQPIPYLLPFDWFEMDGKVTFRYSLAGKKMIVHRLQQDPITMEQYYGMLLGVTDALLECKDYMLRPEGCMLSDSFIFIGDRVDDIHLVYLPLKNGEETGESSSEGLLQLVIRWTTYIEKIDGEGLKRIVQLLGQSSSPLNDLRETLLDLIANGHGSYAVKFNEPPLQQKEQSFFIHEYEQPPALRAEPSSVNKERNGLPSNVLLMNEAEASNSGDLLPFEDEPERMEGKRQGKWTGIAIWTLAVACVWRFLYMSNPSGTNLLISAAVTLLLLAGLLFTWRKPSNLLIRNKDSEDGQGWLEPLSGPLPASASWKARAERESLEIDVPSSTTSSMGNYSVSTQASQLSEPPKRKVLAPTTVLSDKGNKLDDVTALLGAAEHHPWLSRVWNGQEEKIALDADSFKIGRSSEGVGYSENAEGVSRLHLEIERINGEHHAKDLGSRNGSLLNGKLMVPYKAYRLEAGDRIHLAGDKGPLYELRTG